MKTKTILTLVSSFCILHSAFGQGALTPPGAPAPTMKSLDQIEARTPISSVPFTITSSGSYYLTGNLSDSLVVVGHNILHQPIYGSSLAGTNAITIAASGVTLDLNGFTLNCSLGSAGAGIQLASSLRNISIVNGFIQGGVTNNGSGVYSGNGFDYGIYYSGNQPVNVLVTRVLVAGCRLHGIDLNFTNSTVVESCTVQTAGGLGICASTIKNCSAIDCGNDAIFGDQVSDCRGQSSGSDCSGVAATTAVLNCYGSDINGYGVNGTTVQNCYGVAQLSGCGIDAVIAQNCYAINSNGYAIYAGIVQNCEGGNNSSHQDCICAIITAENCWGENAGGGGVGVQSYNIASNCFGYSYSGTGLYAVIANDCYGQSVTGTGLYALIATSCHGQSTSGTALSTPHNVNSY